MTFINPYSQLKGWDSPIFHLIDVRQVQSVAEDAIGRELSEEELELVYGELNWSLETPIAFEHLIYDIIEEIAEDSGQKHDV